MDIDTTAGTTVQHDDNDRSKSLTSPDILTVARMADDNPVGQVGVTGLAGVSGLAASHGWLESERRFLRHRINDSPASINEPSSLLKTSPDMFKINPNLLNSSTVSLVETRESRDKSYLCTVCSALCGSSADLQRHLSKHVSDLKQTDLNSCCTICSLEFINRMALTVHRNSPRHKERELRIRSLFHCDHCGNYFANRDSYAMHMLEVTRESAAAQNSQNGNPKKMNYLGLVEVDAISFLHHLASADKSDHDSTTSSPVQNNSTKVTTMVKEEPRDDTNDNLGRNGVTSSTTEDTDNNSVSGNGPKTHQALDLVNVKQEACSSPIDCHTCLVCSQMFDSRDSLAMHAMEHCKEDNFMPETTSTLTLVTCHICGKQFSELAALSIHVLSHSRPIEAVPQPSKINGNTLAFQLVHLGYGDLANEIIRRDSPDSYTCKLCCLDFNSLLTITRHCTCVSHILKVEQLLRKSLMGFGPHKTVSETSMPETSTRHTAHVGSKCERCGKWFERDCDYEVHKALMCSNRPASPLLSPQTSVCSEPVMDRNERKRSCEVTDPVTKRVRSASSEHHVLSRKDPFPRKCFNSESRESRRGSDRPVSVDSGRSLTPDPDASTNRLHILSYLENQKDLQMCSYCKVVYADRTMYHLHMGLHNHNNPWQCNLCGKICTNVHEFSSHVIHYQ